MRLVSAFERARSHSFTLRESCGSIMQSPSRHSWSACNATASVFHQRHIGRVLRSSCNVRGRRLASSRGREPRPGRCPPLWPGYLRNDGGRVAAAGAGGSEADWMEPFARTIDAAKKYVVSSTLDRVDWNAELVRGDLGKAVQQLKRESGKG